MSQEFQAKRMRVDPTRCPKEHYAGRVDSAIKRLNQLAPDVKVNIEKLCPHSWRLKIGASVYREHHDPLDAISGYINIHKIGTREEDKKLASK